MQPLIWKHPAEQVIRGTPDNGRTLVIMGDHPDKHYDTLCAWNIANSFVVKPFIDNMAINNAAEGHPVDYMATLHSWDLGRHDHFPLSSVHDSTTVIGYDCGRLLTPRVDHRIDASPLGGTSALFAVIAGLVLGYKSIYLCGVRLDPGTVYHDCHVEENWTLWMPLFRQHLTVVGDSWLRELCNENI